MIETGQDLPSGKVAGDAEDDDDVVIGLRARIPGGMGYSLGIFLYK